MSSPSYGTAIINEQQLEIRMQVQATPQHKAAGTTTRYFPAPLLRHNLQYNEARDGKPNFPASIVATEDRYQPFWSSNKLTV